MHNASMLDALGAKFGLYKRVLLQNNHPNIKRKVVSYPVQVYYSLMFYVAALT